jgi:2-polyprenyl-6-methoxyphenol hydroxylase-like FAD-dependent oxidoreductase
MSGLLAALMLKQDGWRVEVFERAEGGLAGRGAGIVAQPEMIARLAGIGLDTREIGVSVTARRVFDGEGRLVASSVCPQVLTAWERVYHMLRGAFPDAHYHPGRSFAALRQDASGVLAYSATAARNAQTCSLARTVFARLCGSNFCRLLLHSTRVM